MKASRVWAAALMAALPAAAYGLGSRIANQDAEAVARGNAFVATANNPSAVYYNPAGIRQLPGGQVRLGSYLTMVESQYRSPNGAFSSTKDKPAMVPQMFGTYTPDKSRFSFGLGIYSPFGLGTIWPEDSGFSTRATTTQLTYIRVNPVVAVDLVPGLSLGAGPAFNYSSVVLKNSLPAPGQEFTFDGNNVDVGFNAGILWKFHPQFSTGFSYHSASSINYQGSTNTPGLAREEEADARLEFPLWFTWGLSYRPDPHWNIEFNLEYTDWDSLDTVTIRRSSGDISIPFDWEPGFMYKLGATYDFLNGWSISAGYFYTEQTVPDRTFTPGVPDTEVHTGSVGATYRRGPWTYAAAAQLTMGPWRDVSGSPVSTSGESADGKFRYIIPAINLSLGYQF
ncbi:MAG: outer membrane protein transport protein [Candidatus Methylacidiphilales bacterium]|nr:outer membrane protein transport protein [Candidatus Methylacidiphilales bacterium]